MQVRDVAAVLYSTKRPNSSEIQAVEVQFAAGRLRGVCAGAGASQRWTTTPQLLAEFMASEAYRRQLEADGTSVASRLPTDPLSKSYSAVLTDYFQAVVFRRRAKLRDRQFQRAVVAGQAVFVSAILIAATMSVRSLFFSGAVSPQRAAIQSWISERYPRFEILKLQPLDLKEAESEVAVRVQYRYFRSGGKRIETDRVFRLVNQRVIAVDSYE